MLFTTVGKIWEQLSKLSSCFHLQHLFMFSCATSLEEGYKGRRRDVIGLGGNESRWVSTFALMRMMMRRMIVTFKHICIIVCIYQCQKSISAGKVGWIVSIQMLNYHIWKLKSSRTQPHFTVNNRNESCWVSTFALMGMMMRRMIAIPFSRKGASIQLLNYHMGGNLLTVQSMEMMSYFFFFWPLFSAI